MTERIDTFTGETIVYDEKKHKYFSLDGVPLMGASSYAKQFGEEFNKEMILPKVAKAWEMQEKEVDHLWKINADISNAFGTAIHAAMELWFRYNTHGKRIQDKKKSEYNYALPKNVHIRDIVLSFVSTFGDIDGVPEAWLSAVEKRMAGRADLIHITGEKRCRVGDYKTNNEMTDDKLVKYQHQLSFYADILTHHGWTVEGLDIYYHDGKEWKRIELEVLPVVLDTPKETARELFTLAPRPPVFKKVY